MSEIAQELADLTILLFVISSMFGMGLNLTLKQIFSPLRRVTLVIKALIANFVLVPLLAYLIAVVIDLDEPMTIGLMLMATAAGAAFLPKLATIAKGDVALSVGLMTLMTVVTLVFLPLALPFLLPGVEVDPLQVAQTLLFFILAPLAIGLLIKARYEDIAATLQPYMAQTATYSLMVAAVLMLVLNFDNLLRAFGTGTYIAVLLFVAGSFLLGYFLGGPGGVSRRVLGLGTAQRDISTALLVASRNFDDPGVLVMILVGSLAMLVGLMVVAGEFGKRSQDVALPEHA
jgi:BASS family bile acid:Na+ symporter